MRSWWKDRLFKIFTNNKRRSHEYKTYDVFIKRQGLEIVHCMTRSLIYLFCLKNRSMGSGLYMP
jgi:hypothetical protein